MHVSRRLILGLVTLAWFPLLGLLVYSFERAEPENKLVGGLVLGLLPLVVLILSRWSSKSNWEEATIPLVALTGFAVVVVFVYFEIPAWWWVRPDLRHVADGQRPDCQPSALTLGDYEATPQEVVEKMLSLANVTEKDVVYDLGCGDGRIVITAAKEYGARGVGIDIDPERVKEAMENVRQAGVQDLVEIREGDATKAEDLHRATVVALYIEPEAALRLRPMLEDQLKPKSRIVSHEHDFGPWEPDRMTQVYLDEEDEEDEERHLIYLWEIDGTKKPPAKAAETP